MYHKTKLYRVFNIGNCVLLGALSVLCLLPMIHIFAVSLSSKIPASANAVGLWPVQWTFDAYRQTLENENFLRALGVSVVRTLTGTGLSLVLLVFTAYPLSKERSVLRARNLFIWFFVFTMLFSGGLVPNYILIKTLHLRDTLWALILPGALPAFSLILLINFFRTVPREIEEAALIDGAGYIRILFRIFIPLSLPAIAALSLFAMVVHWNSWFDGLIYLTDYRKYPLSTFLQSIVVQQDFSKLNMNGSELANISNRTVKSSQIFISALPVLAAYPFLQKYFVKGIVLGAVKE